MMRLVRACALAAAVVLAGCASNDLEPSASSVVLDRRADRQVVFLPPLGPAPADYGDIVLDSMPTAVAEEIDPSDGTTVIRTLRTWTRTGPGVARIRVRLQRYLPDDGDDDPSGYFVVPFRPATFGLLVGDLVRFRVELAGSELGTADLTVANKSTHRAADVRFRIDRLSADHDGDTDGTPDVDDVCPLTWDPDQVDTVGNGVGDACRCDDVDCGEPDSGCAVPTCGATTGECSDPYCIDEHPALIWGDVLGITFGQLSGALVAITSSTTGQTIYETTDEDGNFSIEIPFAESDMRVSKARFDDYTAHLHFSPDSMAEDYEVVLTPNVATYDVVVWSAVNTPLPSAEVTLEFDNHVRSGGATDQAGHLSLTDLPIGVGFQLKVTGLGPTYDQHQDPLFAGYNSVTVGLY